jgi:hypothetical protein
MVHEERQIYRRDWSRKYLTALLALCAALLFAIGVVLWGDFGVLAQLCGVLVGVAALVLAADTASWHRSLSLAADVDSLTRQFRLTLSLTEAGVRGVEVCDGGLPESVRGQLARSHKLDALLSASMHPAVLAQLGGIAELDRPMWRGARFAVFGGEVPSYLRYLGARARAVTGYGGSSFLISDNGVAILVAPGVTGASGTVLVEIDSSAAVAEAYRKAFESVWAESETGSMQAAR